MIAYLVQLSILIVIVIGLVVYYSESEVLPYVKILVSISWLLSLVIILILPVDIFQTSTTGNNKQVKYIWAIIYYINFVLTWIVLPLAQQYQDAGQFDWKGKIQRSLRNNAIMLLVIFGLGFCLLLYLIFSGQFVISKLPSIFATLANLFGIVLVVIFLGHGLISLPKECFKKSNYKKLVEINQKTAHLISTRKSDTQFDLEVEIRKINYIKSSSRNYLFEGYCQSILQIIPNYIREEARGDAKTFELNELQNITYSKIADINRVVKRKVSELRMYDSWMSEIVRSVESIQRNVIKNNYKYHQILYLIGMVITTFLSFIVFFGQFSTFVTVFERASLLHYINSVKNQIMVYILNTCILLYITFNIAHSVFEMKIFGLYSLHRRHSTAASLLFTSINLSRVSYPLCYNYLQITGMPKIAFLKFFGQISIGENLTFIFPILLIVFACFNLFDIYDRIMTFLGLGNYAFDIQQNEQYRKQGRSAIEKIRHEKRGMRVSKNIKQSEAYMELGQI